MGVRFRRSKSLGKFGKVNLTKGGLGFSIGPKGARIGIGPRGAYTSAGIPGTGIYGINYLNKSKKQANSKLMEEQQQNESAGLPIPSELNPPKTIGVILVASIILLFIQPEVAFVGLLVYLFLYFRVNKSEKASARKSFVRGKKALEKKDYKEALTSFISVLDFDESIISLYPVVAGLYKNQEMFTEAAEKYSNYLELVPDDYMAKMDYAVVLADSGKPEEAVSILQSLPEDLRNNVEIVSLLGAVFLKAGKPDLAITALEKGPTRKRTMDAHMMRFRYVLGKAYKEEGEYKKAIKQLQKVYAEDISFMDVAEELAELESQL